MVGLLLLQAAVLATAGAASARENQCPVALQPPGKCLRGQAFAHLTSVTTPTACCAACTARRPQCVAFEVRAWGRGGTEWTCILLNTTDNTIEGNCSASGSVMGPPPAPSPPQPPGPPPSPPPTLAFASIFSGGAVLQKEARVAVWGTSSGAAGSIVQLLLGGTHVASATVDINGTWLAHLPPQRVNWGIILTVHDAQGVASVTVKFGQVLMCSGQVSSAYHPSGLCGYSPRFAGWVAARMSLLLICRAWGSEQHGDACLPCTTWFFGGRRSGRGGQRREIH